MLNTSRKSIEPGLKVFQPWNVRMRLMREELLPGIFGLWRCHFTDYLVVGDNPFLLSMVLATIPRGSRILVWRPGLRDNWPYEVLRYPGYEKVASHIAKLPNHSPDAGTWLEQLSNLAIARHDLGMITEVGEGHKLNAMSRKADSADGQLHFALWPGRIPEPEKNSELPSHQLALQTECVNMLHSALLPTPTLIFRRSKAACHINRIAKPRMTFIDSGAVFAKKLVLVSPVLDMALPGDDERVMRLGAARACGRTQEQQITEAFEDLLIVSNEVSNGSN